MTTLRTLPLPVLSVYKSAICSIRLVDSEPKTFLTLVTHGSQAEYTFSLQGSVLSLGFAVRQSHTKSLSKHYLLRQKVKVSNRSWGE